MPAQCKKKTSQLSAQSSWTLSSELGGDGESGTIDSHTRIAPGSLWDAPLRHAEEPPSSFPALLNLHQGAAVPTADRRTPQALSSSSGFFASCIRDTEVGSLYQNTAMLSIIFE